MADEKIKLERNELKVFFMAMIFLAGFTGSVFAQDSCVEPPSGIVSWWGGDNNALDIVGENHGTLVNGTDYSTGMVGQCFSFDGVDDYISVPSDPSIDPTTEATLEAWVYFNQLPSAAGHIMEIMAKSGFNTDLDILANTNDRVYFYVGAGVNVASNTVIQAGQWYHIACVYKAADRLEIFIDGLLDNSITISVTRGTNSNPFTLGAAAQWPGRYLSGLLDEAAIYNRAMSADEIAAICNAGSAGKCRSCAGLPANIFSWWKAENDPNDSIGTNHGTLLGGATFAQGKVGQAFSLDGTDDSVMIPKIAEWDFGTASFSITSWFKSGTTGYRNIIRYDSGSAGGLWGIRFETGGKIQFLIANINRTGAGLTTPLSYSDNNWHFVAAVRDSSASKLKIYVDGSLAAEGSEPNLDVVGGSNTYPAIGRCGSYNGEYFSGIIDEVAVFQKALSPDEIAAIYNAGSSGMCPPPNTLLVTKDGTGTGTVTSDPLGIDCGATCSFDFNAGSSVTLTAAADFGSVFAGWGSDCSSCGTNTECALTMDSSKTCTAEFNMIPRAGESSKTGSPMTPAFGTGTSVDVSYAPANCATDHAIYYGTGPITDALDWTNSVCGFGVSGSASFDPGDPAPESFFYFVVVGNNGYFEGSYGKDSSGAERPEATGLPGCDWQQELSGACD